MRVGVWGLGFGIWGMGLGYGVWRFGVIVDALFNLYMVRSVQRISEVGFRASGLGFEVQSCSAELVVRVPAVAHHDHHTIPA